MEIRWLLSLNLIGWFSRSILIILFILSLVSWKIIFQKLFHFHRVRRAIRKRAVTDKELLNLEKGLPILASITSLSPFLGLLGTVWGILLIFSRLHWNVGSGLEIVAPGIAQALLTTVAGLLVAIPSLFFYNYFSTVLHFLSLEKKEKNKSILHHGDTEAQRKDNC